MTIHYRAIFSSIVAALLIGTALLFLASFVMNHVWVWSQKGRSPLGEIRGVIASDRAVFVGASQYGRVYKFGYDGQCLAWKNVNGAPISISAHEGIITVRYSGETIDLRAPEFAVADPKGVTVILRRVWLMHPVLEVDGPSGKHRASLQPWYLTMIQMPLPGMLWGFFAVGFFVLFLLLRRPALRT